MTQIQMIVETSTGRVEGAWEELTDGTVEDVRRGIEQLLMHENASVGLLTDDGVVLIPVRAAVSVRIRTLATPAPREPLPWLTAFPRHEYPREAQ